MLVSKYISAWWNRNGWTFIFCLSFFLVFILWLTNTGKENASADTDITNVMNYALRNNISKNFENTKKVMDQLERKKNHEFVYESGASKGENECRRILEEITGMKFYKVRPDFMKNPVTGVFLELDCYNDDLKLAVEYNGAQHDKYNKFMHQGSIDKFRAQQYRDYIKKTLCKENNVYLIVVPHTIKIKDLKKVLIEQQKPYIDQRMTTHNSNIVV